MAGAAGAAGDGTEREAPIRAWFGDEGGKRGRTGSHVSCHS